MKNISIAALVLFSLCAVTHGQNRPANSPPATNALPRAATTDKVDRLLEISYLAEGGDAHSRITTRVVRGRIKMSGSDLTGSFEKYEKNPRKSMMVANTPRGQFIEVSDGNRHWVQTPWNMTATAGYSDEAMARHASNRGGAKWRQIFSAASLKGVGRIDGREMIVLAVTPHGQPPMLWHFDAQTGLLRKLEFVNPVAGDGGQRLLGVYYDSYATVDGVKVPSVMRQVYEKFTLTFQADEIKHNVLIDDALFTNPNGK